MREFWSMVQMFFSALGGFLGYYLGGCDGLLYVLIALVALDYATGVMYAVIERRLSSHVGFRGIFRKVLIFALVGIGHLLDEQIFGHGGILRTAVIFFYLSNEGISVLENAAGLGLPVPERLRLVLDQLRRGSEEGVG